MTPSFFFLTPSFVTAVITKRNDGVREREVTKHGVDALLQQIVEEEKAMDARDIHGGEMVESPKAESVAARRQSLPPPLPRLQEKGVWRQLSGSESR